MKQHFYSIVSILLEQHNFNLNSFSVFLSVSDFQQLSNEKWISYFRQLRSRKSLNLS